MRDHKLTVHILGGRIRRKRWTWANRMKNASMRSDTSNEFKRANREERYTSRCILNDYSHSGGHTHT